MGAWNGFQTNSLVPVASNLARAFNDRQLTAAPSRIDNTPGVIRTRDLRIRSPALYPAELRSHFIN